MPHIGDELLIAKGEQGVASLASSPLHKVACLVSNKAFLGAEKPRHNTTFHSAISDDEALQSGLEPSPAACIKLQRTPDSERSRNLTTDQITGLHPYPRERRQPNPPVLHE